MNCHIEVFWFHSFQSMCIAFTKLFLWYCHLFVTSICPGMYASLVQSRSPRITDIKNQNGKFSFLVHFSVHLELPSNSKFVTSVLSVNSSCTSRRTCSVKTVADWSTTMLLTLRCFLRTGIAASYKLIIRLDLKEIRVS